MLNTQSMQNVFHHVCKGHLRSYEAKYCSIVSFMINRAINTSQVDHRKIIYKNYVKPCWEDHDHKNMRLNRPMSPHVLDYGPTVPSMTSIAERITGTVLSFYAISLASGSLFLSNGIDTYVTMIHSLNLPSYMEFIVKLIVGFPFWYHYCVGLRFVGFNMLKFLDVKTAYRTAYASIFAAIAAAVVFATL